jgi:hypothetical protein
LVNVKCAITLSCRLDLCPYLAHFKCRVGKVSVSSLYEATKNELQGSGIEISKKSTRALKVTDFEIIAPSDFNVKVEVVTVKVLNILNKKFKILSSSFFWRL